MSAELFKVWFYEQIILKWIFLNKSNLEKSTPTFKQWLMPFGYRATNKQRYQSTKWNFTEKAIRQRCSREFVKDLQE